MRNFSHLFSFLYDRCWLSSWVLVHGSRHSILAFQVPASLAAGFHSIHIERVWEGGGTLFFSVGTGTVREAWHSFLHNSRFLSFLFFIFLLFFNFS